MKLHEDLNINKNKKIMLIYPPSNLYQRGEDRCQSNIESSTATSIRACNDLGYASAMLKKEHISTFLKDYQTENLSMQNLIDDFKSYKPHVLFLSVTNATIFQDIEVVEELKKIDNNLIIILKGAIFFNAEDDLMKQLDLKEIDYLIGGESDFIISDLIKAHFDKDKKIDEIRGIIYNRDGEWIKTDFKTWEKDLDKLAFPDRTLMNNELYVRPDTGEAQATITTSRGCPAACIYCLTPHISGKETRLRTPKDIFEELKESYTKHNIKNFFFKSDTFTIDRQWVTKLCEYIIDSELYGKIEWVANSRVKPLEKETLEIMKKAGCWLIAFGFESGSPETMKKIKKGATVEDNIKAAKFAKEVGLKIFGFYLIGLPWEKMSHLKETEQLIYDINADFIEVHIATPYYGTELYSMAKKEGLIDETILGKDYFNSPTIGTKYLSIAEVEAFKKELLLKYHLRPSYIGRKLSDGFQNPKILKNYFKFGSKLIKQNMKKANHEIA